MRRYDPARGPPAGGGGGIDPDREAGRKHAGRGSLQGPARHARDRGDRDQPPGRPHIRGFVKRMGHHGAEADRRCPAAGRTGKALVLDSTVEMFTYYDRDLNVIWVNRAAAAFIGREPADLVGYRCYEIWHNRIVSATYARCHCLRPGSLKRPRSPHPTEGPSSAGIPSSMKRGTYRSH